MFLHIDPEKERKRSYFFRHKNYT